MRDVSRHMTPSCIAVAGVLVFGLVAPACAPGSVPDRDRPGHDTAMLSGPNQSPGTVTATGSISFVDVGSGRVLGDPTGLPLYANETDTDGAGACGDTCAPRWRPLPASDATPAPGIDASRIGAITRPDGTRQLTYAGRPLYRCTDDRPGRATCQGSEGAWWLLGADGSLNKEPA